MAQIGVQSPSNLMDMYSSPSPMLWDIANNQVNQQSQGNAINQQSALQDMDFARQKLPFELNQMDLANQTTAAGLPGVQANSSLTQDRANISSLTLPQQRQAAIADLAAKTSRDQLETTETSIKQLMADTADLPDSHPVRQTALHLEQSIGAIRAEKAKQDAETARQLGVTRQQGSNAIALDAQEAAEGKYIKRWNMGIDQQIAFEGNPEKKDNLIRQAYEQARQRGDTNGMEQYQGYLAANKPSYDNYMATKPTIGNKVNVPNMTGLPAIAPPAAQPPVNANPSAAPADNTPQDVPKVSAKKKTPQEYSDWATKAKQINPGMSDAEIRAIAQAKGYL